MQENVMLGIYTTNASTKALLAFDSIYLVYELASREVCTLIEHK